MTPPQQLIAGALMAVASCESFAQHSPAIRDGWTLVWHDEFEGGTLDAEKWRVEHAALVKNNELQFYAADEVYLEDGCLVLRSRAREMGGRAYTSGLVDTQHRFSQAFGRFEIRARLPEAQGVWPAHWMLPENHPSWPPEIDIMEMLGHEPDTVYLTQHWGTWPDNHHEGVAVKGPSFSDDFHTFAVEWSPDRIDWFVDGELRYSRTTEVPRVPFHIILNTAVGGDWPGNPDGTTAFPQYHRIDYVRVYAREQADHATLGLVHPHGRVDLEPPQLPFPPGATVTARATPDFGYRFAGWDDAPDSQDPLTFRAGGVRTIRARFEPDPHLPPLLSGAATATATSDASEFLGAGNAIDGFPGTRWASAMAEPQELTLDLGGPARVELLRIVWDDAYPSRCEVLTSANGQEWQPLHSLQKSSASEDVLPGGEGPVRFLSLRCTDPATPWGVSVREFEVYGRRLEP